MEIFGLTISMAIVWIVVAVIFVAVEAMTMGLTCIWFAGGAFAAMILALLKASVWTQIFVFLIVSIVALVFTRKLFVEKLRTGTEKTNVDAIIDQEATIIETIEPHCAGIAKVGGQEWTAVASSPQQRFEKGERVTVCAIEGVKLIVDQVKMEE